VKVRVLSINNIRKKGIMLYKNAIVPLKIWGNFEFTIENKPLGCNLFF
jgi:hypothetical protein